MTGKMMVLRIGIRNRNRFTEKGQSMSSVLDI